MFFSSAVLGSPAPATLGGTEDGASWAPSLRAWCCGRCRPPEERLPISQGPSQPAPPAARGGDPRGRRCRFLSHGAKADGPDSIRGEWRSSLLRDCSWGEFHKARSFPRGAVFLQRSVSRNQNPWGQRGILSKSLDLPLQELGGPQKLWASLSSWGSLGLRIEGAGSRETPAFPLWAEVTGQRGLPGDPGWPRLMCGVFPGARVPESAVALV